MDESFRGEFLPATGGGPILWVVVVGFLILVLGVAFLQALKR